MELSETTKKFVLHWGEMGTSWGVNRSVAQIHALLYFIGKPLNAEEIANTLGLARSNVSNSIKELLSWKLISVTHLMGDRRDHYSTQLDVWELLRVIVKGRKEREFDPTIQTLSDMIETQAFAKEPIEVQKRVRDTLALMQSLTAWSEEMLRLEPSTLHKVIQLGARVQQLVRGSTSSSKK
jgi:DNA-binding transcriptional regulator GbsR (MarR family)